MQDERFRSVTINLSTYRSLGLRPLYAQPDAIKTGARRDVERYEIAVAEAAVGRD
jgi:hypothetical protein